MSTRRRKVLIALHSPLLGGATISVIRPLPLLEEQGWDVAFWVPSPGPARDWLETEGYEVRGTERPLASSLRALGEPPGTLRRISAVPDYLRAYARALREFSPDVVHANSLYAFEEALFARSRRLPVVLHVHDMLPRSRKAWPAKRIARHSATVTLAVSEACADSYAYGGWKPDLVYEAAPVGEVTVAIRDTPRPFVIGTVGVISKRKGSDLFVEAARMAQAEMGQDALEFQMIGAPTDSLESAWGADVLARARKNNVHHRLSADVQQALATWDAFVLPSRRDPCPIALLEAMAVGLPCIGTEQDGIPEQLDEGAGLLVRSDDAADLARTIVVLARTNSVERRRLGQRARARVKEKFSLERQAQGLVDAYGRALAA